jgi:hypothetical protein
MMRWSLVAITCLFTIVAALLVQADAVAAGKKKTAGALVVQSELTDKDAKDKVRTDSYCKIYNFKMEKGKTYQIDMKSKNLDAYLRLEDPEGKQVAKDDDGGDGLNARIIYEAKESGEFRIIATTYAGNATGKFELTARDKNAPPDAGKVVELKSKNGLASYKGTLEKDDPQYMKKISKIFTIEFEADKTYQIDHMSMEFDAYLYLLSPDGKLVLAQDDDGGEGLNSRIVFKAEKAGVYRIVATSLGGTRTGEFTFTVREK